MKKLNSIWQKISNQGITDDLSSGEAKRIKLTNRIGLVVGLVLLPYALQYEDMGLIVAAQIQLLTVFLLLAIPLLNKFRLLIFSRFFLLCVGSFSIFFTSSVMGYANGDHLGLVLVVLASFVLFGLNQRGPLIIAVSLPFLCLGLLELTDYATFEQATIDPADQKINYLVNLILAMGISGLIAYYFQGLSDRQVNDIVVRAQRELQEVFDNSFDAIFILDLEDHRIKECNQRSLDMFGYMRKSVLKNSYINQLYLNPMSEEEENRIETRLQNGEIWSEESPFVRKNKEVFWGNAAFTFINYGEKKELLIRITDISEKKAAEDAIILAKEKAEEANRAKDNFLANMSHEIRTPINGIIGLAEIINVEAENDEMETYASMVMESGHRLLHTLGSILDLTRLEASDHTMELSYQSVNQLVQKAVAGIEESATQKGLYFELTLPDEELFAPMNETYCIQSIQHLLNNALKFTEEGGLTLWIEGPDKEAENQFVSIYLADTGIGMRDEFVKNKLFMKFEQESEGLDRNFEGSGLGLSIVKRIVELMGGRINVVSKKGEGSTFRMDFPMNVNEVASI